MVALYVGGMGARGQELLQRARDALRLRAEARTIQDLYLEGKKKEAEAAVPEEFLELTTLCGPASYVRERIAAFAAAGVTHFAVQPAPLAGQTNVSLIEAVREMV